MKAGDYAVAYDVLATDQQEARAMASLSLAAALRAAGKNPEDFVLTEEKGQNVLTRVIVASLRKEAVHG